MHARPGRRRGRCTLGRGRRGLDRRTPRGAGHARREARPGRPFQAVKDVEVVEIGRSSSGLDPPVPGNTAETTSLLPALRAFQERRGITGPDGGMVVVTDAGMLSASNVNAIEDARFSFIVGSRITRAPYDLAEHFARHGDYFTDGQILESTRAMGSGKHERDRRVVHQWSFKCSQRDNKMINAQIARRRRPSPAIPLTRPGS
jgi:hypothetical protein